MKALTKEKQASISPEMALDLLKQGNERFVKCLPVKRDLLEQTQQTAAGQHPFATILSCIDSRTSSELIFDQGIGDIFSIRIAGNVVNDDILGSMEFATKVAGTKIVVVLGHTKCGAVTGACNDVELDNLTTLLQKIKPAINKEVATKDNRTGTNTTFVENVAELNVKLALDKIRQQSPILADLESNQAIKIIGGMYDVATGMVSFYE